MSNLKIVPTNIFLTSSAQDHTLNKEPGCENQRAIFKSAETGMFSFQGQCYEFCGTFSLFFVLLNAYNTNLQLTLPFSDYSVLVLGYYS